MLFFGLAAIWVDGIHTLNQVNLRAGLKIKNNDD